MRRPSILLLFITACLFTGCDSGPKAPLISFSVSSPAPGSEMTTIKWSIKGDVEYPKRGYNLLCFDSSGKKIWTENTGVLQTSGVFDVPVSVASRIVSIKSTSGILE